MGLGLSMRALDEAKNSSGKSIVSDIMDKNETNNRTRDTRKNVKVMDDKDVQMPEFMSRKLRPKSYADNSSKTKTPKELFSGVEAVKKSKLNKSDIQGTNGPNGLMRYLDEQKTKQKG